VARKKKKVEAHGGGVHAPAWMISWADMTTLLWACFVLLWSFSTLDLVKFQAAMSSLQGALGVLQGGAMVLNPGQIPQTRDNKSAPASKTQMEKIRQSVKKQAQASGLGGSIQTSIDERGLMIRFADTALFDAGSTDIKEQAIAVLDSIAVQLAQVSNPIQVEGHTDPTPISTPQFPSNWELSTGRATAIVHYLVEQGGIPPDRFSAAGYSYYHPVAPNDTPENRAKNRRVDVIVLNSAAHEDSLSREDALSYLESPESSGIILPPAAEVATSTGG
jgi:chemotaxis protein MotB